MLRWVVFLKKTVLSSFKHGHVHGFKPKLASVSPNDLKQNKNKCCLSQLDVNSGTVNDLNKG